MTRRRRGARQRHLEHHVTLAARLDSRIGSRRRRDGAAVVTADARTSLLIAAVVVRHPLIACVRRSAHRRSLLAVVSRWVRCRAPVLGDSSTRLRGDRASTRLLACWPPRRSPGDPQLLSTPRAISSTPPRPAGRGTPRPTPSSAWTAWHGGTMPPREFSTRPPSITHGGSGNRGPSPS